MSCSGYLVRQYGYPLIAIIIGWLILARPWLRSPEPRQPNQEAVSRAVMGEHWPLTVESGILMCLEARLIVFETNGQRYAVNGEAEEHTGYPTINPILASNDDAAGQRITIAPLVERGLALCN